MTRETAVSETISYETGHCSICDTEVAVEQVPQEEVLEEAAYAVILGEGEVNKTPEYNGNWDFEIAFELDEEKQRHPEVQGFIICEGCASGIHGHPEEAAPFRGSIPSEMSGERSDGELPVEIRQVAIAVAVLLLFLLLLAML